MTRPSLDMYFMKQAVDASERGTCDRAKVGCVLVREDAVLVTGYNGAARKMPHCDDVGHLMVEGHCIRSVHAEINAIIRAARHGVSTENTTAYVTHFPCFHCANALRNAGVIRVVYGVAYGSMVDFTLRYFEGVMRLESFT